MLLAIPAGAQITTTNLGMTWPAHLSANGTWDSNVVGNSQIVDNIFGLGTCTSALTWDASLKTLGCNPSINAATLAGSTWAVPPTIGSTTPSPGIFTGLTGSSFTQSSGSITGAPLVYNASGVLVTQNGVIDSSGYTTLSHATKLQTAINDSLTAHKMVNAQGFGSDSFSAEIGLGDVSLDPGAMTLPTNASWLSTVTNGTSCGFKQYPYFKIDGSTSAYNRMTFGLNSAAASVAYVFCNPATDGYYLGSGFQIKNDKVATTSGIGVLFRNWQDGSVLRDAVIYDYFNDIVKWTSACCTSGADNLTVYGNDTSGHGVTIESIGVPSVHGFYINGLSTGHPGTGKYALYVHDTQTTPSINANISNMLYTERNVTDTTTPCYFISGAAVFSVQQWQCTATASSTTAPVFEIANVGAPSIHIGPGNVGGGAGAHFTLPAVAVKNDITGASYPTDANGNFGSYDSGTHYFDVIDQSQGQFKNFPCAPQFSTTDTLSNTSLTSEQFFATTCAIPANSFVAHKVLKLTVGADIVSTASPNFQFKIKLCSVAGCGSGTVITVFNGQNGAPTTGTYSTGEQFYLQGTAAAGGSVSITSSAIGNVTTASGPFGRNNQVSSNSGVPTNGILYLSFSVTFSTTTGTNNMTLAQVVPEWLN